MVTLTLRHRDGMPLRRLLRGMMHAWRRCKQGGAMQRIWRERVKASVRSTEIMHGSHGWHPHLHVLLHTDGLEEDEREELLARWLHAVRETLGEECVPSEERAIRWSDPIDWCKADDRTRARYLVKLGVEVAGPKEGRSGNISHWDVARFAAEGQERMRHLWREFYTATKGRRMVELDDRAARYVRDSQHAEDQKAMLARLMRDPSDVPEAPPLPEQVLSISVDSIELRALRQYEARDPSILATILHDVSVSESPRRVVRAWMAHVTSVLGYNSPHAREPATADPHGVFAHATPRREARGELVYLVGDDGELNGPNVTESRSRGDPCGSSAQAQGP